MAEKREVKQWITVNGKHIPIFEGETKADAVKRATNKKVAEEGVKLAKSFKSKYSNQIDKDNDEKEKQIKQNERERQERNKSAKPVRKQSTHWEELRKRRLAAQSKSKAKSVKKEKDIYEQVADAGKLTAQVAKKVYSKRSKFKTPEEARAYIRDAWEKSDKTFSLREFELMVVAHGNPEWNMRG